MKVVEDYVTINNLFKDYLITMKGVKPNIIDKIDIDAFFATCYAASKLRDEYPILNGYPLTQYKLNKCYTTLLYPRGVYVEISRLAFDHFVIDTVNEISDLGAEILTPSKFMSVQDEISGVTRSASDFSSDLELATKPMLLAEAASVSSNGNNMCHYNEVPFLPINLNKQEFCDAYYNYDCKDMITDLCRVVVGNIGK